MFENQLDEIAVIIFIKYVNDYDPPTIYHCMIRLKSPKSLSHHLEFSFERIQNDFNSPHRVLSSYISFLFPGLRDQNFVNHNQLP